MDAIGRMPLIRTALGVLLLAVAAACSLLPTASPGQAAREALVTNYLGALKRRDAAAIEAMVSPGVDASVDIAQVLERYGGVKLHGGPVGRARPARRGALTRCLVYSPDSEEAGPRAGFPS